MRYYYYNPRFDSEDCDSHARTYDRAYSEGFEDGRKQGREDTIDEVLQTYIHWIENEDRANVSFEEILLRLKEQKNE